MDGDSTTIDNYINKYSAEDLLTLKDYYRRDLELTYIIGACVYALNIIDAAVDAHLFKFDINDDLSMKINPVFFSSRNYSVTGLSFYFTFGKDRKTQSLYNH